MLRKTRLSLAVGVITFGAVAAIAHAQDRNTRVRDENENSESLALRSAKISLAEAIATAERETGGKAYDAGVQTEGPGVRFVIETSGAAGVQTVTVDAQTGQILGAHAGGEED